jgi:uncharacterized protein
VAVLDADDSHHRECIELLSSEPGPLLVPVMCVAEVTHLLGSRVGWGAEVRLLMAIAAAELSVEQIHPAAAERSAELVGAYRDLPLGAVDASVVAAAERLGVTRIATLDRRHFGVVRPAHVDAFELLPA